MKKLRLWLDMYRISATEYWNKLTSSAKLQNTNANLSQLVDKEDSGDADASAIEFSPSALELEEGERGASIATVDPELATQDVVIKAVSDESIISVYSTKAMGYTHINVLGLKAGSATVSVKVNGVTPEITKTLTVTVTAKTS